MQTNPFPLLRQFPELSVWIADKGDGITNAETTAAAFGVDTFASVKQTHGKETVVARGPGQASETADGLVTDTRGLLLTTRWGDCQNFVIYAPERKVVGLLHAGWRGLVAGAIPEFFKVLKKEWKIDAGDTYVGAGPSLCPQCADFTDPEKELPGDWSDFFDGRHVDLQGIGDAQLLLAGVRDDRMERHADCTRCSPDRYWTWRGGHKDEMNGGARNILAARIG